MEGSTPALTNTQRTASARRQCTQDYPRAEHTFQCIGNSVSIGITDIAANVDRIAVERRLNTRHLQALERVAEVDEPRRGAAVQVNGDVALNPVGAKNRLQG